ncbi:MaoC/PaaZ C-terminal domain-containing protein [Paracoccus versutus]|uniref:Acyl dehydratase n=1 Tax=Paracoccus versutus TaxID=34007 RepID=A0A3D9XSK6_PARVE|nr:MaoC/PaaZ C-terminal domain-containing protein [Paracoccus versutus]REF73326.1 acyl dehydratase [Paracoccus versutus]WGR54652.1 3-alpha,7-alpha,12-alpha-trihydroxy-5-beta-cholest-24-enoyl-CoA hydratase [Paracoccus versutus]
MAIDADHLLNYRVEDVRQRYTSRDSAFYALSVGMGQDPLDKARLAFVDPNAGAEQKVLPSMALVLGYPGPWLTRPDTTVDTKRFLHGMQAIEWHRPFPAEGDVIGKTRVLRLVDRGEGKHGMVLSERRIVDATTETPYATLTQVHVLRGQGGFGGDPTPLPAPLALPDTAPDFVVEVPTMPDQALYYRLNGDLFALHADPDMARASGFERPILHGMCVSGIATQVMMGRLAGNDPSRMRSIAMRFSSPVYPGETIRIEGWNDGAFRARCVEREVIVLDNGRAVVAG